MRMRIASVARKLSGITSRRFALSSSVRSKNCTPCVRFAFGSSVTTKRASDAMRSRAHRIPLVRHRRRADLLRLERLFDLADRLQHAQVAAELHRARRDAGDDAEHLRVELARVRLSRDGNRRREADLRA